MGLFSSKKKTYVSTQISRVVADNQIPDMRQKNLIDSVFKNQRLTHTIVNNGLSSHALKVERGYRYAARGDYVYGPSNYSILDAADGKQTVENIIEAELGQTIQFDYFYFTPLNNLHAGWEKLTAEYGYDEFTNEVTVLSAQRGKKTWVKNMVAHVNTIAMQSDVPGEPEILADDGTLNVWDRHPQDRYIPNRGTAPKTSVWKFGELLTDGVEITLVDSAGVEDTLFFDFSQYDDDLECFHAKYRYTENGKKKTGYFTYRYKSGAYPVLDAVHDGNQVTNGTFLPVVLFRHNDVNRTNPSLHETEEYKSTDQLMHLMGLDYQKLGDTIHENPDVDKLDQAALMFAVPAGSDDDVEKEYLFKFFNWLYLQSPDNQQYQTVEGVSHYRPGQAIRIKDADFDCTLSFAKIRRRRQAGTLGKLKSYHQEMIQETRTRTVIRDVSNTSDIDHQEVEETYTVDLMRYRFQVSATSYDEILVEGLQLRYNIYDDKDVTVNAGSDRLLIPVDYTIARTMRFDRKERLYYRSMHFVMNARVTETVKWYERGIFQIVLFVVAVVITILSQGTQAWTLAVAAGTEVVVLLILQAVLKVLVSQFVISKAFEVVIKELGYEIGVILAVVAFVVAGYGDYINADWAAYAIQAGNNLMAASMVDIQREVAGYKAESQEFQLQAEEKMKELEELDNLLNQYELLDPRSFIGKVPVINPGESPDALYDRTVHVGNPGILQYDYIESYVAINTQLPTFNDLVGDSFYGRI